MIPTYHVDSSGRSVEIGAGGTLTVASLFDDIEFNELAVAGTAYNYYTPLAGSGFISGLGFDRTLITLTTAQGDKQIGINTVYGDVGYQIGFFDDLILGIAKFKVNIQAVYFINLGIGMQY